MKKAVIKAWKALSKALPMIFGTILLVSLITTLIPREFYTTIFSKNLFLNSFIGSFIGSISAGNSIISYIIGGELLNQGISFVAVTSFLVAWVTVGFVQIPIEISMLGKRFTIYRNISAFLLAIIIGFITVLILGVF